MSSYKRIFKYLWYAFLYLLSLTFIGIISGVSFYYFSEYKYNEKIKPWMAECMQKGGTEKSCEEILYKF